MFVPMWLCRVLVSAPFFVLIIWYVFRRTPELDGVKHAWYYRIASCAWSIRGMHFLLFTLLGWFPLPE